MTWNIECCSQFLSLPGKLSGQMRALSWGRARARRARRDGTGRFGGTATLDLMHAPTAAREPKGLAFSLPGKLYGGKRCGAVSSLPGKLCGRWGAGPMPSLFQVSYSTQRRTFLTWKVARKSLMQSDLTRPHGSLLWSCFSPTAMPAARRFLFDQSQAGCFHVVNRVYDRHFLLDAEGKEFFLGVLRAYEDALGVEVLTFCLMDNHFHLLLRVPQRPEGFDVPLEVVVERLERALGRLTVQRMHRRLKLWREAGDDAAIENWRLQQVKRMFSLSEFMKSVQQRFSRWYNARAGRRGALWQGRFTSLIVQEAERALRTMAAYIDLNPVRAGMAADPGDYRWGGYAEALAGNPRARRGLVRVIGPAAWGKASLGEWKAREVEIEGRGGAPGGGKAGGFERLPWGAEAFPLGVERRALVYYRALLGGQGAERKGADGGVVRRGLSEKVRERLSSASERRLAEEVLVRRLPPFTRGVILGSRDFVDGWFEGHREVVQGRSREGRKRGSRSLGHAALRGLYSFRRLRT